MCGIPMVGGWEGWIDGFARAGSCAGAECAFTAVASPARAAKDPRQGARRRPGSGTAVIARPKTQVRHPKHVRVLLLNDDYTPMDFVVSVLKKYFQ